MKHTFRKQHFSSLCNACLLLVLGATFLFGACADDDLANEQPGKHTGTTVAFNVSDAQMETLAQASAKGITRGLSPQPLSSADLAPRKLEATGSNSHDFCLIESTVEGINPVKPAEGTRAEIIKTPTSAISHPLAIAQQVRQLQPIPARHCCGFMVKRPIPMAL